MMLARALKIGIVCPYSWDTPGGVQNHIRDLAEFLITAGHQVSVLAPAIDEENLPDYVVNAGKPISIPYNGAVARVPLVQLPSLAFVNGFLMVSSIYFIYMNQRFRRLHCLLVGQLMDQWLAPFMLRLSVKRSFLQ
jgi:hypothetical protein